MHPEKIILNEAELTLAITLLTHDLEKLVAITARIIQRILDKSLTLDHPQHRALVTSAGYGMERSRQMIADLNEVLSNRSLPIRLQNVSLEVVLSRVADRFRPLAESEGISFGAEYDADGTVVTDPDLITRIAENFLYNALSHVTLDGWISLSVHTDTAGGFHISVSNAGDNIPQADTDRIFDPGVQLKNSRKQGWQGRGLGLTFCRMAAESLDAGVGVRNLETPAGISFYCRKGGNAS